MSDSDSPETSRPESGLERRLRAEGLTKVGLANKAGCAPSTIHLWVAGYRPRKITSRLAAALGVSPEELG